MKQKNMLKHYVNYRKKYVEYEKEEEKKYHQNEIFHLNENREERLRAINNLKAKKQQDIEEMILCRLSRKDIIKTEIKINDILLIANYSLKNIIRSGFKEFQENIEKFPLGIVDNIGNNFIDLWIYKPIPDFIFKNKLIIHLYMNEVTYKRQIEGLIYMLKRQSPPWDKIAKILTNNITEEKIYEKEDKDYSDFFFFDENLNDEQKQFVINALNNKYFTLLHGPFGTGKTTSLIELICQYFKEGKKILVSSDSNTGVDNILYRLIKFGFFNESDIVRVGPISKLYRNESFQHSVFSHIENNKRYKEITNIKDEIDKLKKSQKSFDKPKPSNRRGLSNNEIKKFGQQGKLYRGIKPKILSSMKKWIEIQEEINDKIKEKNQIREEIINEIIENANIVISTNSMVFSDFLKHEKFDISVIDESSQSTEPSNIMPIVLSNKFVLAGDHKQLPPTVLSDKAKPLEKSLFEKLIDYYGYFEEIYNLLKVQYRMNEQLIDFPDKTFYDGNLVTSNIVKYTSIKNIIKNEKPLNNIGLDKEFSLYWINVKGEEKQKDKQFSYFNEAEIKKVEEIVNTLIKGGINKQNIGVISPYSLQVSILTEKLKDIEVNTIDGFQGREKEIIIISYVRSNKEGHIGFLKDYRRLNVAITRAKMMLINIGNINTLSYNNIFKSYFDNIKSNGKII